MSTGHGLIGFVSGIFSSEIAKKIYGEFLGGASDIFVSKAKDTLKIKTGGKGKGDEIIYLMASLWPLHTDDTSWELTKDEMFVVEGYIRYLLNVDKGRNNDPNYVKMHGKSYLLPDFILFVAQSASEFERTVDRKKPSQNKKEDGKSKDKGGDKIVERRNLKHSVTFLKRLSMEPNHEARLALCDDYRVWEDHLTEKYLSRGLEYAKDFGKGAKKIGSTMIENAKTVLPAPQPGSTDPLETLRDKAKSWRDSQRLKRR